MLPGTPHAAPRPLPALEPFAGYRELETLSVGPHYIVQRAQRADGGAPVAIKRLRSDLVHDELAQARLQREAQLGMSLRSAHVARVLEIHTQPALHVVLEHVPGLPLSVLLERAQAGATREHVVDVALRALLDVLHGLSSLHFSKDPRGLDFVVHRAPSVRHMLVGSDGVTRLFDLTHAHGSHLGSLSRDPSLRPDELAPEQVTAPTSVDPRCDVFIVGLALWQVLTGAPLFAPGRADLDARFALAFPVRHIRDAGAASWAEPFNVICQRALAEHRRDRFASALQMAQALEATARAAGRLADRAAVGAAVRALLPQTVARAGEPAEAERVGRETLLPDSAKPPVAAPTSSAPGEHDASAELVSGTRRVAELERAARADPFEARASLRESSDASLDSARAHSDALHDLPAAHASVHSLEQADSFSQAEILELAASKNAFRSFERSRATLYTVAPPRVRKHKLAVGLVLSLGVLVAGARLHTGVAPSAAPEPTTRAAVPVAVPAQVEVARAAGPARSFAPVVTQLARTEPAPDRASSPRPSAQTPAGAAPRAMRRREPRMASDKRRADGLFQPEVIFYDPQSEVADVADAPATRAGRQAGL